MVQYTVKYKQKIFWKKLKAEADGFTEPGTHRFFILADKTRIEIPLAGTKFQFCPMRFAAIKEAKEQEIGQPIKTKF